MGTGKLLARGVESRIAANQQVATRRWIVQQHYSVIQGKARALRDEGYRRWKSMTCMVRSPVEKLIRPSPAELTSLHYS